ncbi:MAG: hypothetical protein WD512_07565, partial [Candidatus Paceibacterota bacterium]
YSTTDIFGDTRNPSGKNLHQRLNQNLILSEQAGIDTCTLPSAVPFVDVASVSLDFGSDNILVDTGGDTTGSKVIIWATAPLSQGTKFVKNRLRKIAVITGDDALATDVFNQYTAKFGSFASTDNIFFGARTINANGQASPLEVIKAVEL